MYKRIISLLQDYFGVSRKEARGALALIIVCMLLIWTPFVFRRYFLPLLPASEPLSTQKLDSIVARIESENAFKRKQGREAPGGKFREKAEKPVRYFPFDPNQATIDELTELGIPAFLARRIDKFRSKGGKFKKKEDLLHIYDFPSDIYQKLEKFIVLPETQPFSKKSDYAEKARNSTPGETIVKSRQPNISVFDVNTADTTQLVKLRGIGTKLSMRILKFRDGLGGFHSKEQYREIFGLDSLALSELHKYGEIASPVRKIKINTATAEELGGHTYLKNKKLVSIIVNYRNQHGHFKNMEELKNVKVLGDDLLHKLAPYISFE